MSSAEVKTLLQKASTEANAHQYAKAAADIASVLHQQPNNVYALFDRALLAQIEGRPVVALAGYDVVLHQQPTYVPALYNSGLIYTKSDPPRALELFREIIQIRHTAPIAYLSLGLLEDKLGHHAQAAADLSTALQQQPSLRSRLTKAQQRTVSATKGAPKATPKPTASP